MPVVLFMIGLLSLVLLRRDPQHFAHGSGMGAYVGQQLQDAISRGTTTAWIAMFSGLRARGRDGRSPKDDRRCHDGARLTSAGGRRRRCASLRSGLVTVMVVAAGLVNKVRDAVGWRWTLRRSCRGGVHGGLVLRVPGPAEGYG
jgi:hypothetical protein